RPARSRPEEPTALWCADYKGEFMLRNRRYCYPLTITDFATRYLLVCDALPSTQASFAFTVFERACKDFGLPATIRTDNGVPFAAPTALYRLSKLSVWWLRLGIRLERIQPGHPQHNAPHALMTHTPKKWPPGLQQSHVKKRSHQTGRRERAAAASALRRLHRALQPRAAAPSA